MYLSSQGFVDSVLVKSQGLSTFLVFLEASIFKWKRIKRQTNYPSSFKTLVLENFSVGVSRASNSMHLLITTILLSLTTTYSQSNKVRSVDDRVYANLIHIAYTIGTKGETSIYEASNYPKPTP
ncbi:hypothetical protein H5410_019873 [Solanum commersonii]|uniref:Uncharacterized protein n=1 Tax=Solanum commersonii TaxID=4109 RepID=A0A9J5Z9J9_SOLCO|nr:hypothetical protein H5410_019873 [Solanum commersonii]